MDSQAGAYQPNSQYEQQFGGQQSGAQMNSQTQGASNDYYQQGAQQMDQRPGNQAKAQGYGQGQQQPNSQGVNTQSGQPAGAGLPPQAAEQQDGLHKFLDRIEKKFGGDRFNNPENAEKNRKLNDSIIKKAMQVGKIIMRKGPAMLMKVMR